ncbi:MAG: hypothetical protein WC803_10610 [Sphingomonas sp.]|jgi:hypothetical protein
MKFIACAALSALLVSPALAQTAPSAAPATPAAQPAGAVAKFNLETPIEAIAANEMAKAVLNANIPGITEHPAFDQFKALSLKALQPLAQGAITDDQLKKIEAELAALK